MNFLKYEQDTKECLTLYKVFSKLVKEEKKKNKSVNKVDGDAENRKNNWFKTIIFSTLTLIIFLSFVVDYFNNVNCNILNSNVWYPLLVLFINLLLSLSIIIYIFISRSVDRRIEGMIQAFNHVEYKNLCRTMYTWLDIKFRYFRKNIQNQKIRILLKILYCIVWIAGVFFIVCYVYKNTNLFAGLSGYVVVFLFVISSIMQGYSFFYSFVYIRFLHKVSQNSNRESLEKYEYNFFLPAQSSGYRQLMSNINFNSTCFIIESLLFVTTFIILSFLTSKNVEIMKNFSDLVFYSIYVILCVVGSLIIYMVPKYMMKRIITVWTDRSRRILEKRLNGKVNEVLKNKDIKYEKKSEEIIKITENEIANLQKESHVFNGDYINLVLVAVTLLLTLIPIILKIYGIG